MKFVNWLLLTFDRLVSWITRKRNIGLGVLAVTSPVLVALAAGAFTIEVWGGNSLFAYLKLSSADGDIGYSYYCILGLAAIAWIAGGSMVLIDWHSARKEASLFRVLALELRGLVDTSDHPLKKSLPAAFVGSVEDCLVDVRPYVQGSTPNISSAIEEIAHIQKTLRMRRGGTSREHVRVVVGGVMQVPLLFYAGCLIEDEGSVAILDWDRTEGKWRELNQPDDGVRFDVEGLGFAGSVREVVLAVSASYKASLDDIEMTFPTLPLVHMSKLDPKPNTLWSEAGQKALTQQFLEVLAKLANQGVNTVHLVLAAPSSICIRFGRAYDARNMPRLLCYQRMQGQSPPYPWSLRMPHGCQPVELVETPEPISNLA